MHDILWPVWFTVEREPIVRRSAKAKSENTFAAAILCLGRGASEAADVAVTGVGDRNRRKRSRRRPLRSSHSRAAEEIVVAEQPAKETEVGATMTRRSLGGQRKRRREGNSSGVRTELAPECEETEREERERERKSEGLGL
ncbi:hypothetical protein TIFTF001_018107 [Ficus carica]|uniref:Uncharacterized protein n=1 Tax=Ficus carica TaxID=3494 RepID=A0AA88AMD4_FICCA|nr:hypothetical protein TIFTF001_018107 [Ficus carica]